jgi:hypothetical protein
MNIKTISKYLLILALLAGLFIVSKEAEAATYNNGDLIQSERGGSVYLIKNGQRRPIHSADVFEIRKYRWKQIKKVAHRTLIAIPRGKIITYYNHTLVRAYSSGTVWAIYNSHKYSIPSPSVFRAYGYKWSQIKEMPQKKIDKVPTNGSVTKIPKKNQNRSRSRTSINNGDLIQSQSGGSVYLIKNGKRRPIHSADVFRIRGYKWSQIKKVSRSRVNNITKGKIITYYNGTLLRAYGTGTVWVVKNSRRYYIPSAAVFNSLGYKWGEIKDISKRKLRKIPARGSVTLGVDEFVDLTAKNEFVLRKGSTVIGRYPGGTDIKVGYKNGAYLVMIPSDNRTFTTRFAIKLQPTRGVAIVESYDQTNKYNQFRGEIIVQYSSSSNKLWVINKLPLKSYLKGMIEAGNNIDNHNDPLTYQKVMTTIARTYAAYYIQRGGRHGDEPFHLKNSRFGNGSDQVYAGYKAEKANLTAAVNRTAGDLVTNSSNEVIVTPYSHGGYVKYYKNSQGNRTRETKSHCENNNGQWLPNREVCLRTMKGSEFWSGDIDHCEAVSDPHTDRQWECGTRGNHCVGLSAYGAIGYAQNGRNYKWILGHYYSNTKINSTSYNPHIRVSIYGFTP